MAADASGSRAGVQLYSSPDTCKKALLRKGSNQRYFGSVWHLSAFASGDQVAKKKKKSFAKDVG